MVWQQKKYLLKLFVIFPSVIPNNIALSNRAVNFELDLFNPTCFPSERGTGRVLGTKVRICLLYHAASTFNDTWNEK